MGIFDRFPYSSTHEMNLDFMLGKATEIAEDMQTVATGMAQVQAGLSAISEKTEQATQAAAQAAQSASSIEGSVTAAEEAAEEAQMHNESAQTWANNAMTYKADCQRSATEAAASSVSAAQAATAAAGSEDTVAQYAQAANASAQSAANNNDSAHQYANQASASASNATFHSSNAQTAATNANTSATNAETAATNAQTAATRASALKDDCQTLHSLCTTAVDLAGEKAVAAANSAAQAAATKTDVETLVESLPEDFTDLNNTVNQLSDEIDGIGSDVTDLKSALQDFANNGFSKIQKTINWFSAYVDANGVIRASQTSRTALVPLSKGEKVTVGTANSNITIIGTTTANSVAVGDSITPVEKTTTEAFETHSYKADADVNVVICVKWSDYSVKFEDYSDALQRIADTSNDAVNGFTHTAPITNGGFAGSGVTTGATNRIRTDYIPVFNGEKIVIDNGSLEHICGMWEGSVSTATIRRNDNTWHTEDETILASYDGFLVVVFRLPNNGTITVNDFDGDIECYNTLPYRNKITIEEITGTELPEYYNSNGYLDSKIARINELGENGDDVFAFVTDIHWELNAKHSPALLKTISDKCALHKVFDGGDVADTIKLDVYKKYRNSVAGKTYHITGNHDWFSPSNGKRLYYAMDSANNDQIGNPFKHYYYVDNVQQKIRYVILNCFARAEGSTTLTVTYDSEQINWFTSVALDIPADDWDVIVFTHILKTTSINVAGAQDICDAIDAFNEDTAHAGKILGVFQGHTHWDAIYHTTGGVPIITTTCDKLDFSNEPELSQGQAGRVLGTITEQAFDIVILNRTARTFTAVRIGAPAQNNINLIRTDSNFEWIGTLEERVISY